MSTLPQIEGRDACVEMRSSIRCIVTGPEYSKDLGLEEAQEAMGPALKVETGPIQAAVLLIALRRKRETCAGFKGALKAKNTQIYVNRSY